MPFSPLPGMVGANHPDRVAFSAGISKDISGRHHHLPQWQSPQAAPGLGPSTRACWKSISGRHEMEADVDSRSITKRRSKSRLSTRLSVREDAMKSRRAENIVKSPFTLCGSGCGVPLFHTAFKG